VDQKELLFSFKGDNISTVTIAVHPAFPDAVGPSKAGGVLHLKRCSAPLGKF